MAPMEAILTVVGPSLPYIQIALALLLTVAILLQKTGSSLGGAFGADNFSSGFHTRRGAEKVLFQITIVLAVLVVISAFVSLLAQ
jgi:protein translocase SecG subunit